MSELIKHECGIGMVRLLKPISYFQEKYGTALWGLNRMYVLMEKQRNRGQDGAGIACVKMDSKPGHPYMKRMRDNQSTPWTNLFKRINAQLQALKDQFGEEDALQPHILKEHFDLAGEVLLGHLRYGTHGENNLEACHPVSRMSNWKNRSMVLAGNYNLTNVDYLFKKLIELGQHPRHMTDTETILERIGHFLDVGNEKLYQKYQKQGYGANEIANMIAEDIDISKIIKKAAKIWDGGYVIGGIIGNGDAFVVRDPNGIRPAYYYHNDEYFVAASERAAISTVFNIPPNQIHELQAGHVVSVKASGKVSEKQFVKDGDMPALTSCSFERIYFSRGSDIDIYKERKALGKAIVPQVLESIEYDLENTVFSFIPNTAEISFWGMMQEIEIYQNARKAEMIRELGDNPDPDEITRIVNLRPRSEKAVIKDAKMRTFIADDSSRDDLISHVYDVTQGILRPNEENLVCIDDSIVRGNTLRKSILSILDRLKPKKIVIVSSAPQIRYPDCYGIDMSQIHKLVAFDAAVHLLRERGMGNVIDQVYNDIQIMKKEDRMHMQNAVQAIYAPFTEEEVSAKIAELLMPANLEAELEIVYLPLAKLSTAIPDHLGDWYFSGNYPTPGGNRVVNQSFLNYYEGKSTRAYQVV